MLRPKGWWTGLTRFQLSWQSPMRITTCSSLKWANCKKRSTTEMRGILTTNSNRQWTHCVAHQEMPTFQCYLGERSAGSLCVNCYCSSPICFCLMNLRTTLTLRVFSGSNSTLKSIQAPSLRSRTIGISWTTWLNGFLNLIGVAHTPTRATTQRISKPSLLASRLRDRKT